MIDKSADKPRGLPAEIGRIAYSRQGRDKGRYFMITEVIDEQYVFIADGVVRKLIKPKRKKLKHLALKPIILEGIAEKLKNNVKVFDAELKSAIINTGLISQKEEG